VKVVPAALLISVIEESFFRVLIFRNLLKRCSVFSAVVLCSALYAVAHLIAPVKSFRYEEFSLLAGFHYLNTVVTRMTLPGAWQVFLGLFLVGIVLCGVMYRTNSLSLCIGLHAGWVIGLKMAKHLAWAWGSVGLVAVLLLLLERRKRKKS